VPPEVPPAVMPTVPDRPAPAGSRRSEILDAAAALFAASGYRGTTIAAVARQVGMTDAGVLHHFKNKEALLLGVLHEYGRSVEAEIERAGARGIDLLLMVRDWGVGMEQRPEISSLLITLTTEYLTGDAPARRAIQAAYRRGLDRYIAAFATAAATGDLRGDLDPVHEASALVAHLDGIRLQWFLADGALSMADSVRRYVDDTLARLAPPAPSEGPGPHP
jgi:AcrR family transcriptional regulator